MTKCASQVYHHNIKIILEIKQYQSCGSSIQVKLEFGNVGFSGGRKTGEPGEKPSEQRREPTTNSTHIWHLAGIQPRPQWWEALALSTLHRPQSPKLWY